MISNQNKLFIILVILFNIIILSACKSSYIKSSTIFSEFEELSFLDEFATKKIEIDESLVDKISKGMNINIEYKKTKAKFEAYQFKSPEECRKFVEDKTGVSYSGIVNTKHIHYSWYAKSMAIYSTKTQLFNREGLYIVFKDEKYYSVFSNSYIKRFDELLEFIKDHLSVPVENENIKYIEEK